MSCIILHGNHSLSLQDISRDHKLPGSSLSQGKREGWSKVDDVSHICESCPSADLSLFQSFTFCCASIHNPGRKKGQLVLLFSSPREGWSEGGGVSLAPLLIFHSFTLSLFHTLTLSLSSSAGGKREGWEAMCHRCESRPPAALLRVTLQACNQP